MVAVARTGASKGPLQNTTTSKVNQEYFAVSLALVKCADSGENTDRPATVAGYVYLNYYIIQFQINKAFLI